MKSQPAHFISLSEGGRASAGREGLRPSEIACLVGRALDALKSRAITEHVAKRVAALIIIASSGWAATGSAIGSASAPLQTAECARDDFVIVGFEMPDSRGFGSDATCGRSHRDWQGFGFYSWPMTQNSEQCSYLDSNHNLWDAANLYLDTNEILPSSLQFTQSWSTWTGPLQLSLNGFSSSNHFDEAAGEAGEVAPALTPISGSIAARELLRAWKTLQHRKASHDTVLILTAHWAHETHGGRSMFNYNFGGIKGHGPDGRSCVRDAHEGSGFHVRALRDRFRAYESTREGAQDYLSLLIRKYSEAVMAAERGDVTDFVAALKRGGYFTGSEADYARSMSELVVKAFEQGFDALSSDRG